MKEIRLTIPEGCKTVIIKVDGEQVITEFEPIEEYWIPNCGDIIAFGGDPNDLSVGIFNRFDSKGGHEDYVNVNNICYIDRIYFNKENLRIDNMRPATEKEKQRLFDALAKEGYRWNAKEKKIEKLPRWRAEIGGSYYSIGICGVINPNDVRAASDDKNYEAGNYFKTREEAERVAKKIRRSSKTAR